MYYLLEPEVSGQFGEKSELDTNVHPPIVEKLHVIFDGWLGDDIIELFPCFIVSERLRNGIKRSALTGYQFDNIILTKSKQFKEIYGERIIPNFYWFKINGKLELDDFWISKNHMLSVTKQALDLLNKFNINYADISRV